ncbi:MAG: NIPSNAP family protein [Terracidiphilus sp.]
MMNYKAAQSALTGWKRNAWMICGTALISFAAGSLMTARLMYPKQVRADNNRVFELMVYHTLPGKAPVLESIFRDVAKLQDKHGLSVVGYWVPDDKDPAWSNTFVYLVAHPSREEADKNWHALHADPAFPEYRKQAAEVIEKADNGFKVDEVFMRPTDYSEMK